MANTVLLTRSIADCEKIKNQLEAKEYQVICEPFINITFHDFDLPDLDNYAGIIVTSSNAVKALAHNHYTIPIYCVGMQTSQAARDKGFKAIINADGAVTDLVSKIENNPTDGLYLYLRGRDISQDLKKCLPAYDIDEIITYRVDIIDEINPDTTLKIIEGEIDKILFFSARTVVAFARWVRHHPDKAGVERGLKQTQALFLGKSMIKSLSDIKWQNIAIAPFPTRDSLLDLL